MDPRPLEAAARRAADALAAMTGPDGQLGDRTDLAAYYKAGRLLHDAGHLRAARAWCDYVGRSFLVPGGDLRTAPGLKTTDALLASFPGYMNGWVITAARRLGAFALADEAWGYLRRFYHPRLGGCCLEGPYDPRGGNTVELLMTAHLGVAALHMGDATLARAMGGALLGFLRRQTDPGCFYLRADDQGTLITGFPVDATFVHEVQADAIEQGWFFIGYPAAFLGLLFRATGEGGYLQGAADYLDFALRCPALPGEHFGHKVGWAAALVGAMTRDPRHLGLAAAVAATLVSAQAEDGLWLPGASTDTRLDQSAEVALWLLEIAAWASLPG